jgi:hypothetical protein
VREFLAKPRGAKPPVITHPSEEEGRVYLAISSSSRSLRRCVRCRRTFNSILGSLVADRGDKADKALLVRQIAALDRNV